MFAQAAFVDSNAHLLRSPKRHPGAEVCQKDLASHVFSATEPHQVAIYSSNAEIYAQGSKAVALYQVEFGTVRIFRLLADGRRQISAFHVAGEVFGFEADTTHRFFAEAVSRCGIRIYQRPVDVDLARAILPLALDALVRTQEHLIVIGRQCATERVAAFLLDLMERQGGQGHVELAMSRTDIADYLGLTIETVSRAISKFRDSGFIHLKSARAVEIMDADALRELCA